MKPEYYDEMMDGHDKEHDDGNMEGHDKEYHDDKMGGHDDHEHKMMDKEEEKDIKKSGDDHDYGHDHEEGMEHEGKEMMKDMKKQGIVITYCYSEGPNPDLTVLMMGERLH